jgi:hypothetical protein
MTEPPEIKTLLGDGLVDRRRVTTGAERLLAVLVRQGLEGRALPAATGLMLELDRPREAP